MPNVDPTTDRAAYDGGWLMFAYGFQAGVLVMGLIALLAKVVTHW